jgi:hypothetical protein
MKMSRLMAIGLASSLMVSAVNAAEYVALQRAYQAAKDPATRAAIIQRMQAVRTRDQERMGRQLGRSRQAMSQRLGDFRSWVINNQGKILAAAAAIAVAALAAGAVALEFQERNEILNIFKENGVDVSNPATARYVINLSQLAKKGWNPLYDYISKLNPENADILMGYMQMPGFKASLQKVLGYERSQTVDRLEDIIPTSQKRTKEREHAETTGRVFERMKRGEGVPVTEYLETFGYFGN